MDAYLDPLRRYARLDGRSAPSRFWVFVLVNVVAVNLILQVDVAMGWTFAGGAFGYLSTAAALAVLVPTLAAAVRRLHDAGSEGVLLLSVLVPLIGWAVLFFLLVRSSQRGPNEYGPDPSGWEPSAPTIDGSVPQATVGHRRLALCPWCGKSNPRGRETCQWCHRPYSDLPEEGVALHLS